MLERRHQGLEASPSLLNSKFCFKLNLCTAQLKYTALQLCCGKISHPMSTDTQAHQAAVQLIKLQHLQGHLVLATPSQEHLRLQPHSVINMAVIQVRSAVEQTEQTVQLPCSSLYTAVITSQGWQTNRSRPAAGCSHPGTSFACIPPQRRHELKPEHVGAGKRS